MISILHGKVEVNTKSWQRGQKHVDKDGAGDYNVGIANKKRTEEVNKGAEENSAGASTDKKRTPSYQEQLGALQSNHYKRKRKKLVQKQFRTRRKLLAVI